MKKTYDRKVFKRKLLSDRRTVTVTIRLFMILLLGFPLLTRAGTVDSTRVANREVRGKVIDEKKQPIPGVSVRLGGTSMGTATDVDGKFKLLIPADTATLVVSFIGMKTEVVKVPRLKAGEEQKELTIVLTQEDKPDFGMKTMPLYYCTMTPYDAKFKGLHILFDKENVENTIGEYISKQGLKQLRIAETEKYAHVTFFLNGGREEPFEGESRILVPSPKVATYDLQPEMSAPIVTEKIVEQLNEKSVDFICLNYANGDMVGHTGVYEAIRKAVATVDECVGKTVAAARANGYDVLIIADHGNADNAVNEDGTPNTAHSLNPVPCIWVTDSKCDHLRDGVLADVAPTVLAIMGLPQPKEMTGKSLLV